jgi:hypothetical protein
MASYINKKRVETIAKNNKVEYPGKVAKNIEPLATSCSTNPSYQQLSYNSNPCKCTGKKF